MTDEELVEEAAKAIDDLDWAGQHGGFVLSRRAKVALSQILV